MQKQTKSLLKEINAFIDKKNEPAAMMSRAESIINSAVNYINYLKENFDPEIADAMEKKFLGAIHYNKPHRYVNYHKNILKEGASKPKGIDEKKT